MPSSMEKTGRVSPMNKDKGNQILLIEKLGLILFFYALVFRKKFSHCYFVKPGVMFRFVMKNVRMIPIVYSIVKKLEFADLPGSYFDVEELGYQDLVDTFYEKNENNLFLKIASQFCRDSLYSLVFKKELFNRYTRERLKFFIFLHYLTSQKPDAVITVFPQDNEDFLSLLNMDSALMTCVKNPAFYRFINTLTCCIGSFISVFLFPIFLFLFRFPFYF